MLGGIFLELLENVVKIDFGRPEIQLLNNEITFFGVFSACFFKVKVLRCSYLIFIQHGKN